MIDPYHVQRKDNKKNKKLFRGIREFNFFKKININKIIQMNTRLI